MAKTYEEINKKIMNKEAVVVTAEEMISIVEEKGLKNAAEEVDVVTSATFGPMCSSGAFINLGHTTPRMKMQKVWLNNISAYGGLAAVDIYIGCTELPEGQPSNGKRPLPFKYGGGHLIEEFIAGKDIKLKATSYGTDCYPRKEFETTINIREVNEAYLCNPRNCYQNYNVAVNASKKTIYTYMGTLKPEFGNANYCSAGQLSPLLKDPFYKTIGIGTRIWLAGAQGYVYWQGTQHSPNSPRGKNGIPTAGSGTLAVVGDMKSMNPDFVRGTSVPGYGVSLTMGIGIPIPILNEEIAQHTAAKDSEILAPITDYSESYPYSKGGNLGLIDYASLKSGEIDVQGKKIPTSGLSSYKKALEIAELLKKEIAQAKFSITQPVQLLPQAGSDIKFKMLRER